METFLIMFIISAIVSVAAYLLTPSATDDAVEASSEDSFKSPDNNNGRVIPRVYGYARLSGNCIYYGDYAVSPIRK